MISSQYNLRCTHRTDYSSNVFSLRLLCSFLREDGVVIARWSPALVGGCRLQAAEGCGRQQWDFNPVQFFTP